MKSLAVALSLVSSILVGGCLVGTETDEYAMDEFDQGEPVDTVSDAVNGKCVAGCMTKTGKQKLACIRDCRSNLDRSCTSDDDCRLYESFCYNCSCVPLSVDSPNPPCGGPYTMCVTGPCHLFEAKCVARQCVKVPSL